MNVEIRDERFREVVGDDVTFERLGQGFAFTEGPIWHSGEGHLIFSDMPGDHMRRWHADQGISTFRQPCNKANGNAYDAQGRIVTCEHATSQVTRTGLDGQIEVLATHWQGKTLNSPNDVIVSSSGAIYFTDPTFGRMPYYGVERDCELDFQGVYRLDTDGNLILLIEDFAQPNGLCFSRDERRLFINDTQNGHIRVFNHANDGTLSAGSIWAHTTGEGKGAPDGLKIDSGENVYCSGPGGIHVFAPDATCLGVIRTPEVAANFTWGDRDLRGLFITASSSLYRIRVRLPGIAAH